MASLDAFREFANREGRRLFELPGGLGVRFADGFDVYWVLPEEEWHFLNRKSRPATLERFRELDERRERVVDALRRYLAKQKTAVQLTPNGDWGLIDGAVSSALSVGAGLTYALVEETNLVRAVRDALKGHCLRTPSDRWIERHLSEYGQPLVEHCWPEDEESLTDDLYTPLAALRFMGPCKALQNPSNFESPEAFVAAAEPNGRIGRALLQLAQRLPVAKAAVEVTDGSMCIDFSDEYDAFNVAPKSRELRDLIRKMGPEGAGDRLADEYERLDAARRNVLCAVFSVLKRHGFVLDSSDGGHVGREFREFQLDLGERLTKAIRLSGGEHAVRHVLGDRPELADEAAERLLGSFGAVELPERSLGPPVPPPMELPDLTDERIAALDKQCELLLREYLKTKEALWAHGDPLKWDPRVDSWASDSDWQRLAEKCSKGKHPRPDAELILIDYGDTERERRFIERLLEMEPHYEVSDAAVEMVWRVRNRLPDLGEKWFGTKQYEEVPFADVRARLGDPIAIHYVLGGIDEGDEEEIVPGVLADIPPEMVGRLAGKSRLGKWREAAVRWAEESWRWDYLGEPRVLAVAANMGWPEVCDRLARNPFLLTGLLQAGAEGAGVPSADNLLLAWSKLSPSTFLMKMIGFAFDPDFVKTMESVIARDLKSLGFSDKHLATAAQTARSWLSRLEVTLAIAWHRCRKSIHVE